MPLDRDGVLRELHDLSGSLAKTFDWQPAQATIFVLTGLTPLLNPNKVEIRPAGFRTIKGKGLQPLSCLARIIVTVDPATIPAEVGRLYAKARELLLGRRPRSMSEKHMLLAAFVAEYETVEKAVMEAWNVSYRKWEYKRLSLFSRDARAATRRLLHDSILKHPGMFPHLERTKKA